MSNDKSQEVNPEINLGAAGHQSEEAWAPSSCGCGDEGKDDGHDCHHDDPYGYEANKDAYLKRLRRIEGQVRGLQRMIDEDKYCIDILTQISAATKALQSVALGLLDDHLSHCVVNAARQGGDEAEIKLGEASDAIARLVRS